MVKKCALLFAMFGYLLVVWYYSAGFAPLTWEFGRNLLWHICISCMAISSLHSDALRLAFIVLAPINAAIYAVFGFLAGKLLLTRKRSSDKLT